MQKSRTFAVGRVTKVLSVILGYVVYLIATFMLVVPVIIQTMWKALTDKVDIYNQGTLDGKNHGTLKVSQEPGQNYTASGPLRVYWGIQNPIQLKQFDELATKSPQPQPWRHSCFPTKATETTSSTTSSTTTSTSTLSRIEEFKSQMSQSSSMLRVRIASVADDSSIDTSGVVLRKNHAVKKSNTVAYRGDTGARWKRASINGHIYNNDTRVFIPVMGSCTSVMATDKMSTQDVITALLDKFKVENKPDEFALYIVPDKGNERLLTSKNSPLLERLNLGPDESRGKLFLKERVVPDEPRIAWRTLTAKKGDIPDNLPREDSFETPIEKYVEHLPDEIEQLVALPEALLQGVLQKFLNDEEVHVRKVQRKYDRIRKMMMALLTRQESFV